MSEFELHAPSGHSKIIVGRPLAELTGVLPNAAALIVIDAAVARLYRAALPDLPMIEIEGGEGAKTLDRAGYIYEQCLAHELDRSSWLIGVGGGTICDLVGFCASTYMRGVHCVLAPTTLLSQVDAGVGGKNGVNFVGVKNIIGTIRQPDVVWCDTSVLRSLPKEEVRSGFAEIIKAGAIADAELFSLLESKSVELLALDDAPMTLALERALRVKAHVVEVDESEKGERVKLNFGHTLGHAIEAHAHLAHGYAVSLGMAFEASLSAESFGFKEPNRVIECLRRFELPTRPSAQMIDALHLLRHDKKRCSNSLRLALLKAVGISEVRQLDLSEYEQKAAGWLGAKI